MKPEDREEQAKEAKKTLDEVNAMAIWRGQCKHCGEPVKGTLAQLREHRCGAAG
jgi:hypothetical protein